MTRGRPQGGSRNGCNVREVRERLPHASTEVAAAVDRAAPATESPLRGRPRRTCPVAGGASSPGGSAVHDEALERAEQPARPLRDVREPHEARRRDESRAPALELL